VAVIESLGIVIASGPLESGKHSEQVFVVLRCFSVRYFKRAISKYKKNKEFLEIYFQKSLVFSEISKISPSEIFPLYGIIKILE